jgi:aminopeptidase N
MRAMELAFGREAFDAFLRARFDRLAFHSSDSKAFVADAEPLFTEQRVGWTLAEWLDQPGLPASAPAIDSSEYRALSAAAAALASTGALPDATAWTTTDWTTFLDALPKDVAPASLQALDAKYHLTASTNVPQLTSWLPRAIHADLRATAPAVRAFLLRVGRRWMTLAVFEAALAENDFWRALAAKTFDEAKAGYHPITRGSVAELLAAPAKP